jgi:DNA-binding CsgD family transcriptional regulator
MSGGNPFYALEIAAAAERRGLLVDGTPLDVPGSLGDLLRERLTELSPQALDSVLLVAAASQALTSLVERAAGGTAGFDEAIRQRVLEVDGERLRFTHPLIGSVAYGLATPEERRRAHRRVAEATCDPEERARQLGFGADAADETIAALLESASEAAAARGGAEAAAELFELAATLTPPELSDNRARRRLESARHGSLIGDVNRARSILQDLVDSSPPGALRASALVLLAEVEADSELARELCERALQEVGADSRVLADVHRELAEHLMILGDLHLALEHARIGARFAEDCGDEALLIQSLGVVGHFETYTGEITPGLLEHAVALEQAAVAAPAHYGPAQIYALRLMYADRLDDARDRLELALARAREGGDEFECRNILNHLTQLEVRAGNWARAEQHARELEQQADRLDFHRGVASYARALVDAHLGRVDEARAAAVEGLATIESQGSSFLSAILRAVQGFAELSRGNSAAAAELLGPAASALLEAGYRNPGVRPILPDAVEALLADGRVDDARPLLAALEEGGRALDNPWALATAGRCRGMLLAQEGELDAALEAFEGALHEHERAASPFERARTQLAYGAALRRAKRRADARAMLTEALEAFDALGALLWAENAAAEIARIPGRTRSSGELSETQRRVAELVAGGLSNKEVAAKLFITVRTVESNLSNVYAKLGIRSRTELASRLASSDTS